MVIPYYKTPDGSEVGLKIDPEAIETAASYLGGRIVYIKDFITALFGRKKWMLEGTEEVGNLRKKLLKMKILKEPMCITVQGTFFPCLLLSSGWWERSAKAKRPKLPWRDPLQEWLFFGFEEWGPSWDINLSAVRTKNLSIFAHLGAGDEVNSLPIIIPGEKAKTIRRNLLDERMVFQANVTGLLCHRHHLSKTELPSFGQWSKAFDYCIRLDDEDERHSISRRLDKTTAYSGYLWQCLAPREWLKKGKPPRLNDVYIIWEHTDFTKPSAIEYNLDSLQRKVDYLRSRCGEVVLLQKSSALVPGTPLYPSIKFYNFIMRSGKELGKSRVEENEHS